MSVRLFVHLRDLGEIWYLLFCRKPVEKTQFSFKSDKNRGTAHEDVCMCVAVRGWIVLAMRNVSHNQNTHFVFSDCRKSCRLSDDVVKCGTAGQVTDGNTARRVRCEWWINWSYRHTLRIFNTYWISTAALVTRTPLIVTSYVQYIACFAIIDVPEGLPTEFTVAAVWTDITGAGNWLK